MRIGNISESAKTTELYHSVMRCAEIFSRLSINIPKVLLQVVQNIHGSIDIAAYYVYRATNTYDAKEKLACLEKAQYEIFFLYSRIEYLVKARGLSIGQANEFLLALRSCHEQAGKWLHSARKAYTL